MPLAHFFLYTPTARAVICSELVYRFRQHDCVDNASGALLLFSSGVFFTLLLKDALLILHIASVIRVSMLLIYSSGFSRNDMITFLINFTAEPDFTSNITYFCR